MLAQARHDMNLKLQDAMSEVDQLNEQLEEEQAARSQIQQKLQKALSDANAMKGQLDVEGAGRFVRISFIFFCFLAFCL